jgi:predicted flap endonuclease-1-like 5' DNA nuclease
MLRWLVRLLILGAIVGVGAFIASRLLNREEDWDDFDEDESFEFQETPVEIDVPARDGGQALGAGMETSSAFMGSEEGSSGSDGQAGDTNDNDGPGLLAVKGIGPSFETRLKAIGINTLRDLASASADSLSEQLDVPGGAGTVASWISQAQEMTSGGSASSNGLSNQ